MINYILSNYYHVYANVSFIIKVINFVIIIINKIWK